jgi:hypothetical protein
MTDPLTEESIRTAFADLRARELPQIAPPGVVAAHRTASHRRHAATAVAAGLTGLVLLGGGYAASLMPAEPEPSGPNLGVAPADGPQTPTGPLRSGDPDDLDPPDFDDLHPDLDPELAKRAGLARIVFHAVHPEGFTRGGSSLGFTTADGTGVNVTGGMAIHPGTWEMRVGCGAPRGSVTITGWLTEGNIGRPREDMSSVGEQAYAMTARCGETAAEVTAGVAEMTLEVTEKGRWLYFEEELDKPAQAAGGAVVASASIPIELRR